VADPDDFDPVAFVCTGDGRPRPQFGLAALVVESVLAWLVGRCLDERFPRRAADPGVLDRLALSFACRRAAKRAADLDPDRAGGPENVSAAASEAYEKLLEAGRRAGPEHFARLRSWGRAR
jgi:hypothetical protein